MILSAHATRWNLAFGLLLMVGGCQSMDPPGLDTGTPVAQSRDGRMSADQQPGPTRPCVTIARPAWADQSGSLEGVGESLETQQDADARARADVIKQLEVSITGSDESIQQETSEAGFSYSITSTVIERINLSVSGLELSGGMSTRATSDTFPSRNSTPGARSVLGKSISEI